MCVSRAHTLLSLWKGCEWHWGNLWQGAQPVGLRELKKIFVLLGPGNLWDSLRVPQGSVKLFWLMCICQLASGLTEICQPAVQCFWLGKLGPRFPGAEVLVCFFKNSRTRKQSCVSPSSEALDHLYHLKGVHLCRVPLGVTWGILLQYGASGPLFIGHIESLLRNNSFLVNTGLA